MVASSSHNMIIIYTLQVHKHFGMLPYATACPVDPDGQLGIRSTPLSSANIDNYIEYATPEDRLLLNCCLQLEPDKLFEKVKSKGFNNLDSFIAKHFMPGLSDRLLQDKRDYLLQIINNILNRFYSNVANAQLYLPSEQLPTFWTKLYPYETQLDAFYQFQYSGGALRYSLLALNGTKSLSLMGGTLLSRQPARVLLGNSIFQFEQAIDGNKLIPFFNKQYIDVPETKVDEYLAKVVRPLISSGRVIAKGFTITPVSQDPLPVLHVSTETNTFQRSLFDHSETDKAEASTLYKTFKLGFEYESFKFLSGQIGSTVQIEHSDGKLRIVWVERNEEQENYYTQALKEMGMNLGGRYERRLHQEGIDWLNTHYDQLQALGVEIRQSASAEVQSKNYFIGSSSMEIKLTERQDWFDLEGKVMFGPYEIPLRQIIELIRHKKREMKLPNGQRAQIPQVWIDEYATLFHFVQLNNDEIQLARHHVPLAQQLEQEGLVGLNISDKLQRLLKTEAITDYDLPVNFHGTLRPYQQAGYNWLRFLDEQALGGCLADDMGLGKTVQTLALLQWMKEQARGTSILIAPTSLLYNWRLEVERFCPDLKIIVHSGSQRSSDSLHFERADLLITSYAVLRRDIDLFGKLYFNYVLLDEAQNINNPATSTTQACLQLKARRHLSLTGTPIENSITDLWSQMHFINRDMLGSLSWFQNEFIEKNTPESIKRLQMMVKPFILRRLKSSVVQDLPEKFVYTHYCDMIPEQQEQYRIVKNQCRSMVLAKEEGEDGSKRTSFHLLSGLLRLRQIANHPLLADKAYTGSSDKFEIVTELLSAIVKEGNKVLVFSSFVEHLKLYKAYLDAQGIRYCSIDGSSKDREEQVHRFQHSDSHQVFFLSLKAGGTGLNLTRAGYVFLLDPWWNPAAEAQAFDRAHRIGQKNNVFVYKFITRDTVEEKILLLQQTKLNLANSLILEEDGFAKSLNRAEIEELLR